MYISIIMDINLQLGLNLRMSPQKMKNSQLLKPEKIHVDKETEVSLLGLDTKFSSTLIKQVAYYATILSIYVYTEKS